MVKPIIQPALIVLPCPAADWKRNWQQSYGIGPGNAGIRLSKGSKSGRLLVPVRHKEQLASGSIVTATPIIYSDDNGNSWHVGANSIAEKRPEAQLIELAIGNIMVNSRNGNIADSTNIHPTINISTDGGETWGKDYIDPNLEETSFYSYNGSQTWASCHSL